MLKNRLGVFDHFVGLALKGFTSLTDKNAHIKGVTTSGYLTHAFGLNLTQEDSFMLIQIGKGGFRYSQETRSGIASKRLMKSILLEAPHYSHSFNSDSLRVFQGKEIFIKLKSLFKVYPGSFGSLSFWHADVEKGPVYSISYKKQKSLAILNFGKAFMIFLIFIIANIENNSD